MTEYAIIVSGEPSGGLNSTSGAMADPTGDIRIGGLIALLFFGLFLGWAALIRLDAAAFAPGTLVVTGQRQSVQHRDGGVVRAIMVHEGDQVRRGQLLVSLAAAEVVAQERSLASQAFRLLAQRARLEAEQLGQAHVTPPAEFADLAPEDREAAALALRLQESELRARRGTLLAERQALMKRTARSSEQGRGFRTQVDSAGEQLKLVEQQLDDLRPIAEQGFVSKTRLRELERMRAQLLGQQGQSSASVAEMREAAHESDYRIVEAQSTFRERTASELREIDTRLGEIFPKLVAARDQRARTDIRAPATGTVVGLTVFTPGGVIAPGQKLLDIVPDSTPLNIQIRVSPEDADDLSIGQQTWIKFPSLHDRALPDLKGRLTRLSADAFIEERTGYSYFTGEVEVSDRELAKLRGPEGRRYALRAGLPVEVLVPLRPRTALDYALEPLIGSFWSSFREH